MEEVWIKNGKYKTKAIRVSCKICEDKIDIKKSRFKNHCGYCKRCRMSVIRKYGLRRENWKDGQIVYPSKDPDYERKRALTSRTRRKIEIVLEKGDQCTICKKTYPLHCYAFHHRDPAQKEFTLAKWIRRQIPQEEIDKCDLVCLNCHSILHYGMVMAKGGTYRLDR